MHGDDHPSGGIRSFWGVVLAQFFGAFNDNAFRFFLIAVALKTFQKPGTYYFMIALSGVLFLFPYLLFSMHAGCLADRFSKRLVLNWSKFAEVVVMALGTLAFVTAGPITNDSFRFLFVVLFLMGTQSTYYAPAKYSILPEILPETRLSWGNGILELSGFAAIILGTVFGAFFSEWFEGRYHLATLTFTAVAGLGLAASFLVRRVPASNPTLPILLNPLRDLLKHGKTLLGHRELLFSVLGVVFIWSLGLLFQFTIAVYVTRDLGMKEQEIGVPMAVIAVGVGTGSLVAGYLSRKTIELGLVVIGSVGMSLCAMGLYLSSSSIPGTFAAIAVLGFFAGFLIVPFHAHVQAESPKDDKGGMIATTNWLQTAGMMVAAGVFWALSKFLSPAGVFLVSGVVILFGTILVLWLLPRTLGRLLLWVLCWTSHRNRVEGRSRLETDAPLLLVLDRGSLVEGLLVLSATHRRIRVVYPRLDSSPPRIARWLAALMRATAVETSEEGCQLATRRLADGEKVLLLNLSTASRESRSSSVETLRSVVDGPGLIQVSVSRSGDGRGKFTISLKGTEEPAAPDGDRT